ncbi:abortive infection protein [Gottschalkia purinilytica]|uniref:Abortive infection protein n=1 Tax=Gottschalkia purinilytica TaxID=1503 RepID=A0A0L0WB24_GOTPU|nr:abortive infection family protein [Gottschalkia purinilytica]KNF08520.1 abortive infection protein [Gottschalkia purinilytica]
MFELYSEKLRRLENPNVYDLYEYEPIPKKFRNQVIHLFDKISKICSDEFSDEFYSQSIFFEKLNKLFCEEKGILTLGDYDDITNFQNYILSASTLDVLDLIDLSVKYIELIFYKYNWEGLHLLPIDTLNKRFKTNNLGYEIINCELIKKDTQYTHEEIIKPCLKLIYDESFKGVEDEFFKAHEHFINGDYKDSITSANKAFESTLKTLCDLKRYDYNKDKDTVYTLLNILSDNGFVPTYLKRHFSTLLKTLSSGLPTLRNKRGGHGQGSEKIIVPEYYAKYAINLAATNISFLINIYKDSK